MGAQETQDGPRPSALGSGAWVRCRSQRGNRWLASPGRRRRYHRFRGRRPVRKRQPVQGVTGWPAWDAPFETPLAGTDHPAIALTWPFEVLSGLATFSTRLFRAAAVALVLGMTVVIGALVWVGVLSWWTFAVSVAVIGAVLAWLPRAAHAERLARNRRPAPVTIFTRGPGGGTGRAAAPGRSIQQDTASGAGAAPSDEGPAALAGVSAGSAETRPDSPRAGFGRRHHRGAERPFNLLADGGGWTPVPVPLPTYTLKARAP